MRRYDTLHFELYLCALLRCKSRRKIRFTLITGQKNSKELAANDTSDVVETFVGGTELLRRWGGASRPV